jgi:hypothetical protein
LASLAPQLPCCSVCALVPSGASDRRHRGRDPRLPPDKSSFRSGHSSQSPPQLEPSSFDAAADGACHTLAGWSSSSSLQRETPSCVGAVKRRRAEYEALELVGRNADDCLRAQPDLHGGEGAVPNLSVNGRLRLTKPASGLGDGQESVRIAQHLSLRSMIPEQTGLHAEQSRGRRSFRQDNPLREIAVTRSVEAK